MGFRAAAARATPRLAMFATGATLGLTHAAARAEEKRDLRDLEFGVPSDRNGSSGCKRCKARTAFVRHERGSGGLSPGGLINVDSGVLNPAPMEPLGLNASKAWEKGMLRDRVEATIAHE